MIARGGGGSIVSVLANYVWTGSAGTVHSAAAKAGVMSMTQTLAVEWARHQIRVNAVAPGPVWTPLNPADDGLSPKEVSKFGADSPMGRPAQPEELAPAYVFLASQADSSYITGTVLEVMGGETT